jgi:coenzyme F420-reducing hydrogenase delta subunit
MSDIFEPEILLIYCGNTIANNDYLPEGTKKVAGFKVRFVKMPCSSKIETRYLVKLIEQGADGIELVACPGKQCQFTTGSSRAEHRVRHARTLLEEVGMSGDRLGMVRRTNLSADDIMAIAEERAGKVGPLGQNPMKAAR